MKGILNGSLILYPTTCCLGAFGGLGMTFCILDVRWQSQVLWWAEDRGEGSVLRKAGWGWEETEPRFQQGWRALLPCYCFLSVYSFPPNPGITIIGQFTVKCMLNKIWFPGNIGIWKWFFYCVLLIPSWWRLGMERCPDIVFQSTVKKVCAGSRHHLFSIFRRQKWKDTDLFFQSQL